MFDSCTVLARMLSCECGAARAREDERESEEAGDPFWLLNLVCRSLAGAQTLAHSSQAAQKVMYDHVARTRSDSSGNDRDRT